MTTSSSGDCQHPGMSLRTVQVLLWDLIAPKIRSAERDEVKLVLGRTVEENDELFQEANMLGTIMEDLEGNIHESWAKRKLLDTPSRAMLERDLRKMLGTLKFSVGTSLTSKEKQICEYLQSSKDDAASGRQDSSALQRPFTPRNVLSRPASSCSTSSRPSTAGSTGSLSQLALPDVYKVLQQVESKLNVFDIDTIAPTLKQVLLAEHEALLEDIDYLQQCLQEKSGEREATLEPPSMKELKELGKSLHEVSHVDKLLDVSNRHSDALQFDRIVRDGNDSGNPNRFESSMAMMNNGSLPLHRRVEKMDVNRIPKAPTHHKPASASGKRPSSRARKLRGIVAQARGVTTATAPTRNGQER